MCCWYIVVYQRRTRRKCEKLIVMFIRSLHFLLPSPFFINSLSSIVCLLENSATPGSGLEVVHTKSSSPNRPGLPQRYIRYHHWYNYTRLCLCKFLEKFIEILNFIWSYFDEESFQQRIKKSPRRNMRGSIINVLFQVVISHSKFFHLQKTFLRILCSNKYF